MSWLTSLGLCAAGLAAIIVEFFVPAGGIIGILGLGSIVAGIVTAYSSYGAVIGSIYLIGLVVLTPVTMAVCFKFFPRSIVGRWLILGKRPGAAADAGQSQDDASRCDRPSALVGASGKAFSALRPSGVAVIDGRKYSVVTGGEFLDPGTPLVVTRVDGNRIKVRKGEAES